MILSFIQKGPKEYIKIVVSLSVFKIFKKCIFISSIPYPCPYQYPYLGIIISLY